MLPFRHHHHTAVTAVDVAAVRDWVGADPDDNTIQAYLDRPATVAAAALAILRRRRADLIGTPSQVTVDGDYSRTTDHAADLKALNTAITQLEDLVAAEQPGVDLGGLPVVMSGRMVRRTPWR